MKINKASKNRSKKIIAIIIAILLVAGIGYVVYAKANESWPFRDKATSTTQNSTDDSKIDDSPATTEDQQAADQQKQQDYDNSQTESTAPTDNSDTTTKKQVQVNITTYAQKDNEVQVNGFVAGVVESGGDCKLTLTDSSGKSVSRSRKSQANATNTTCGQSVIPLSALHSGTWTAVLSYSSPTAQGTSGSDAMPPIEVK